MMYKMAETKQLHYFSIHQYTVTFVTKFFYFSQIEFLGMLLRYDSMACYSSSSSNTSFWYLRYQKTVSVSSAHQRY